MRAVIALTSSHDRPLAAAALGALLGGEEVIVFVRDPEVDLLLPAPGFPQTLPDGRRWRRFLEACVREGECVVDDLPRWSTVELTPAFGVACGDDVVAVVIGAAQRPEQIGELRDLLPLAAAVFRSERAVLSAEARAQLASQTAAHAAALASALDGVRGQLQRAAEDAEKARQVAEAASEAKSQFLAIMSHELRTPLNAIAGHVQLIQLGIHGPVTEAQCDALIRVDRGQRHLLGLINQILNLSRIESGQLEYRMADVPLAPLLADVQPLIQPQLIAKQLRYEQSLPEANLRVRADPEKLEQVLLNLLSNAVKFTATGGAISVEADASRATPELVEIRVTDTGMGIGAERLADIFDPFVQVNGGHARETQGAGLGLAISRDLARGMGGELTVHSVPAEGSTFTVILPRA
jgi:signal transduction histidine kinase